MPAGEVLLPLFPRRVATAAVFFLFTLLAALIKRGTSTLGCFAVR